MPDQIDNSSEAAQIAILTEQMAELAQQHKDMQAAQAAAAAAAAPAPESDAVRNLRAMIADLAEQLAAGRAPAPTGAVGSASSHVAPLTNTANGPSPSSLRSLFPDIEAAHITSIINHDFRASDLYKLDSRYCNKEASFSFNGTTGQFETTNKAAKDYKTFNALFIPLVTYFNILSAHAASQRNTPVPMVFFDFIIHLQEIDEEYEWPAVLEYTIVFFNRRRMEMLENGDYSKWGAANSALMTKYVFSNKKVLLKATKASSNGSSGSRSTPASVCLNWNAGRCSGTAKCPSNRIHACSTCGKTEHTAQEHPKSG